MNAAVDLVVGSVVIALGSWRILAGLYGLDLIDRHVPGHDIPDRFLPWWTKPESDDGALIDILVGLVFAGAGVWVLVGAF